MYHFYLWLQFTAFSIICVHDSSFCRRKMMALKQNCYHILYIKPGSFSNTGVDSRRALYIYIYLIFNFTSGCVVSLRQIYILKHKLKRVQFDLVVRSRPCRTNFGQQVSGVFYLLFWKVTAEALLSQAWSPVFLLVNTIFPSLFIDTGDPWFRKKKMI